MLLLLLFFLEGGLGVFSDLSVVIGFSLKGYKFITIRHALLCITLA